MHANSSESEATATDQDIGVLAQQFPPLAAAIMIIVSISLFSACVKACLEKCKSWEAPSSTENSPQQLQEPSEPQFPAPSPPPKSPAAEILREMERSVNLASAQLVKSLSQEVIDNSPPVGTHIPKINFSAPIHSLPSIKQLPRAHTEFSFHIET